ncbi:hypothetical protein D0466_05085 [Peribacillus glennii]|uniref:Uncharacterized protein n=1 Tax=Peribacillus glennii TaxID=2303991 RepID=A0A372LG81_9BACI|nr:hypothetical protein D0466_05085 [Peribacillus glennii]
MHNFKLLNVFVLDSPANIIVFITVFIVLYTLFRTLTKKISGVYIWLFLMAVSILAILFREYFPK